MTFDFRATARQLESLDPAGDEALELVRLGLLVGDVPYRFEAQLSRVLSAWARRVVNYVEKGSGKLNDRADALGEAHLWLLECLREFRPEDDGGSVAVFVRARFNWFRSKTRRDASEGLRSHGRFAVAGASSYARDEFLAAHHRDPSLAELKAATTQLLVEQTRRRVLEKDPTLQDVALDTTVRARMSKDGLLAALADFDNVLVDAAGVLELDTTDGERADDAPAKVQVPSVEMPDFEDRDEEDSYERLLAVALGDSQWAREAFSQRAGDTDSGAEGSDGPGTLRALAGDTHSVAELKKVLVDARGRVRAPHAQWAHLGDVVINEN